MPRQLPWKVHAGSTAPPPRSRTIDNPSLPSPLEDANPTAVDRSGTWPAAVSRSRTSTPVGGKSRRSLTAMLDRSPSTSPPPEPIPEDFMIEGFDHDDRYRMVEDEFLAMANDFTKHLHAAEYQRLKALASTRNADMIRTISRPVTGRMTDLVKKRRTALELAASQRKGLRKALGKRKGRDDSDSDDDDDLPWAGTSLQGLMESPRKQAVPLPVGSSSLGHGDGTSKTHKRPVHTSMLGLSGFATGRVAARPTNSSHAETTTDEDDDDLDAQPIFSGRVDKFKRSEPTLNQKATAVEEMARRRKPASQPPRNVQPKSTSATKAKQEAGLVSAPTTGDDLDEDDEDFLTRIRSRRAQQRRRREGSGTEDDKKGRRSSTVDAIPLF